MVNLYRELQPVDRLSIRIPFPLSSYERKLITLLYQPLIGPDAVSLYFMLWAEGEDMIETNLSHYHLMNALDMPIAQVFESRIALEAIGLLRSWRREEETMRSFIYDVMPPLDAKLFFDDPILSMFLYSKIGEHAYRLLRQRFIVKGSTTAGYSDVSRSFMDVYQPVQQHMPPNDLQLSSGVEKPKDIPFEVQEFDFDALRQGLSEQLVPHSVLTVETKGLIAKLAFLYHFSPKDMQKIVTMSLDEMMQINEAKLKKSASHYYKMTISTEPPAMKKFVKVEEPSDEEPQLESKTKKDGMIENFNALSPIEMLSALAGDKQPFPKDIELVEELVLAYDMPTPVVNVLIHYTCLRNNGRLNKNYMHAIASAWRYSGAETAEEAMKMALDFEHQKQVKEEPKTFVASEAMHAQYKLLRAAAGVFYQIEAAKDDAFTGSELKTKTIELFQQTEPLTLLQMLNDGKEPFSNDLKVVQKALESFDMPQEVFNALIHYAYFTSTNSLNLNFLEAIAASWRKEAIATAEAALDYAKAYQQSKSAKYYKTSYTKEPRVDESKLPEWFKDGQHKKHVEPQPEQSVITDFEAERLKILEELGLDEG